MLPKKHVEMACDLRYGTDKCYYKGIEEGRAKEREKSFDLLLLLEPKLWEVANSMPKTDAEKAIVAKVVKAYEIVRSSIDSHRQQKSS